MSSLALLTILLYIFTKRNVIIKITENKESLIEDRSGFGLWIENNVSMM